MRLWNEQPVYLLNGKVVAYPAGKLYIDYENSNGYDVFVSGGIKGEAIAQKTDMPHVVWVSPRPPYPGTDAG